MSTLATSNKGILGWIERVGNKMPHPLALFTIITGLVILISAICSFAGVTEVHPTSGETLTVVNLLSTNGLLTILETFINNFQTVPILGSITVFTVACGYCERTGLFTTAIKVGLKNAKGSLVVFIICMIACFSNQAGDVAFVIVPTLAAAIFAGLGRNPIAGIFCGYAAVGGGYGTEILPAFLSSVLTPVSNEAAQMIEPGFSMSPLNGYFALFAAAVVVSIVNTLVTVRIIEPRLGKYDPEYADAAIEEEVEEAEVKTVTPEEHRALKLAGLSLLIYFVLLVVLCIPSNSFFRSETGSLLTGSPLMDCIVGLLILMFFIPGVVYGAATKQIRSVADLANMGIESVKSVAPFILLCIMIGQFVSLFSISNLGPILAIAGGSLLQSLDLPIALIIVLFIILVMFVDLFMISGTTKYLIFGPIFVPLFMQLNIHPALTQMAYRIGDCCTNSLSPLNPAFLILLTMCQKYDRRMGMGNIFSAMITYSAFYIVSLIAMLLIWIALGLPTGPTGGIWLS